MSRGITVNEAPSMIWRPPTSTESPWTCNMAVHRGGETASPQRPASYDGAMELGLPASLHGDLARRAAPIACGGALVGLGRRSSPPTIPAPPGSRYPGLRVPPDDRAVVPRVAVSPAAPTSCCTATSARRSATTSSPRWRSSAIVVAWFALATSVVGRCPIRTAPPHVRLRRPILPTLLIAYGVLRNLPVGHPSGPVAR